MKKLKRLRTANRRGRIVSRDDALQDPKTVGPDNVSDASAKG